MTKFGLLLLICFVAPLIRRTNQTAPPGYRTDNSDWWSLLRTGDSNEDIGVQERAPAASNFRILDIDLDDGVFTKAPVKLGKAPVVKRGDASSGRSQICYSSVHDHPKIHLIFESGEVSDSFYLFEDGPDWRGGNLCVKSNFVTETLSVASGLHLGQTPAEVSAILGKPSAVHQNRMIYFYSIQIKTPPADFEKLRNQYPEQSLEELHRNYNFYSLVDCNS